MYFFSLPKKIKQAKHSLYLWKRELESTDWNKCARDSITAVKKYLNPTEQEINKAPTLSYWIITQLILSTFLDFIGFAAFFVPIFGWIFNLFWAPFSSFIVHNLYENTFFTALNLVEELLPIFDFVPTATLAWVYTYGKFFNIWMIRIGRFAWTMLSDTQRQRVKDLKTKAEDLIERNIEKNPQENKKGIQELKKGAEETRKYEDEEAKKDGEKTKRGGEETKRGGEETKRGGEETKRGGEETKRGGEETKRGGEETKRGGEEIKRNEKPNVNEKAHFNNMERTTMPTTTTHLKAN